MTKTILAICLLCLAQTAFSQRRALEEQLNRYFPILPYHKSIKDIADFFLTDSTYIVDTTKSRWQADSNYLFIAAKTSNIQFTHIPVDTLHIWLGKYTVPNKNSNHAIDTVFKLGIGWYYTATPDVTEKTIRYYELLVKEFLPYFNYKLVRKQMVKKAKHGETVYFYNLPESLPALTISWSDGKDHDKPQLAIYLTSRLTD